MMRGLPSAKMPTISVGLIAARRRKTISDQPSGEEFQKERTKTADLAISASQEEYFIVQCAPYAGCSHLGHRHSLFLDLRYKVRMIDLKFALRIIRIDEEAHNLREMRFIHL
jgi:hypothetical protein